MPTAAKQRPSTAYAGLDFIKAAFCPLEFNAMPLKNHPDWAHLGRDKALAALEVGTSLAYARQFPCTNQHGHRKTGTQVVTATFGLAPTDFDMFLGLFTYLKRLPEPPLDGRSFLTADFIARQVGLSTDGQAAYQRIRSRIFRFSYVKYTSSAFWNRETKAHEIKNFGFFNVGGMSRLTESRRPIELHWDPSFLRIVRDGTLLTFDYDFYRELSPAMRRPHLIANRDGWNQRDSSVFLADDFAIHQIGFDEKPALQKMRLFKFRKLLAAAEALDIIRPFSPWKGYFSTKTEGPNHSKLALRWSRGPRLRTKTRDQDARVYTDRIENDALYAQVKELRDEKKKPCPPDTFRRLVSEFGRERMQKQIVVVLAQKEHHPGDFKKSELAAFINRCQHDHPEPDWFRDLRRAERVANFNGVAPNQLSLDLYDTYFQK